MNSNTQNTKIKSITEKTLVVGIDVGSETHCSTDDSRLVLKNLEPELPDSFHIFYREKNLGGMENSKDLLFRTQGKYLITLEGDDFWLSDSKLQRQYDFLENHPDYIAVAHNVQVVDESGTPIKFCHVQEYYAHDYSAKILKKDLMAGQTASILMKNYYKYKIFDIYDGRKDGDLVGDQVINLQLLLHGKIYHFNEKLSAYRYVPFFGNSYSAKVASKSDKLKETVERYGRFYQYVLDIGGHEDVLFALQQLYAFYLIKIYRRDHKEEYLVQFRKVASENPVRVYGYIAKKLLTHPFMYPISRYKSRTLKGYYRRKYPELV